jgi:preprotein translocase subunit SecG
VCERERETDRRETEIAAAILCFLWFVNIILATAVYQKRKKKLSDITYITRVKETLNKNSKPYE